MKKKNILLLIILLVIGFASVSTTLILNGTLDIGFNNKDFDVVFTSANISNDFGQSVQDSVKSRLTISDPLSIEDNGKSFSFTTNLLSVVGETNIVNYTIKNRSKNYDANVTINCGVDESANALLEYISIEQSLTSPFTLTSGEEKIGNITIELIKPFTGEDAEIEYKCTLVASPTERDTLGGERLPYTDPILNGADPVGLSINMPATTSSEGGVGDIETADDMTESAVSSRAILKRHMLIPVTISDSGEVKYADVYEEWYNYTKKEWANAVILNEGVTHTVGEVIPESDIESYFVWVPRFKYQIFDEGNYSTAIDSKPTENLAKEIQIVFENNNTIPSTGSTKDSWLTHPAFTDFGSNGFWVGKFETGYKGATTKEEAQVNKKDSTKIIIKPNAYSWRNNTVSNMFKSAYSYNYGSNSHMMKNTEWGAVAYLSHSKYGINGKININNNSDFKTGYSAADGTDQSDYNGTTGTDETVTLPYNTPTGAKASTTGNITGIYDMSGGAWEYVASYMPSSNDASGFNSSDFTNYSRYFDVYPSNTTVTSFNNRILGDAIGEMGPFYNYADTRGNMRVHNSWHASYANFIDSSYPWLVRGALYVYGGIAGQFSSSANTGENAINDGFRIVLASYIGDDLGMLG